MLKLRVITAAILIPLVLLAIWFASPAMFALILTLIMVLAGWEWSKLVGFDSIILRLIYVVVVILGLFLIHWLPSGYTLVIGALAVVWGLVAIVQYQRCQQPAGFQLPALRIILGLLLIVPCWVALIILKASPSFGPVWLFTLLFIVWGADSGGYFVGKYHGKKHLTTKVSPKKTWEGLWGGLVVAMLIAVVMSFFIPTIHGWLYPLFYGLCLVTAIASVIGDLIISLLKRIVGVKDSGKLIPGHGGILDRIDSVLAASIIFTLGALLL